MDFSPAESFLSVEDSASFKSLFSESCSPAAMTTTSSPPPSDFSDKRSGEDKKPVKKRKSWGQELPVPTTNLPPRKRAKTEAEKEQRRIERVLRNRAAAQSSRERKRKEVEALEDEKQVIKDENVRLTVRLADMEAERLSLHRRILAMAAEMSVFRSILGDKAPAASADEITFDFTSSSDFGLPQQQPTLDPTDLLTEPSAAETAAEARDVTQHPAAMLLIDLQCPSTCSLRPRSSRRRSHSATRLTVSVRRQRSSRSSRRAARLVRSIPTSSFSTPTRPSRSTLTASSASTPTRSSSTLSSLTMPLPCSSTLPCSPLLARPLDDATGALQQSATGDGITKPLKSRTVLRGADKLVDDAAHAVTDPAEALRHCCALIEASRGAQPKRVGLYC